MNKSRRYLKVKTNTTLAYLNIARVFLLRQDHKIRRSPKSKFSFFFASDAMCLENQLRNKIFLQYKTKSYLNLFVVEPINKVPKFNSIFPKLRATPFYTYKRIIRDGPKMLSQILFINIKKLQKGVYV